MNPKTIIVGVVGLVFAGITVFMVLNFLGGQKDKIKQEVISEQQKVPPTIPTRMVLVAKKDLVVGTEVGREDLIWQKWPAESISPAYAVQDDGLTSAGKSEEKKVTIEDFIGGVVRQPIAAGQPMSKGLVARAGDRGFLAAVLQPGMRAMSIGVNAVSGISGFILPGDRVDILWDVKGGKKSIPFTQTLMRNIRVIAVDTQTQASGATKAKTVTLELTPHQAEAISLAQNMGTLEFVLRSIAPDKKDQKELDASEEGLLAVNMGEGTGAGALIGRQILLTSKDAEIVEITKDSWTVAADLLYNKRTKRKDRGAPPKDPRPVGLPGGAGGAGGGGGQTGKPKPTNVIPAASSGPKITIVRATQAQTVRVKK